MMGARRRDRGSEAGREVNVEEVEGRGAGRLARVVTSARGEVEASTKARVDH